MSLGEDLQKLEKYGTEAFDADDELRGNALEDSGHPADPNLDNPVYYNGEPREHYTYTGTDQQAYQQWVDGTISTQQFQERTPPGEGTAALELNNSTSGDLPIGMLAIGGVIAVILIMEVSN